MSRSLVLFVALAAASCSPTSSPDTPAGSSSVVAVTASSAPAAQPAPTPAPTPAATASAAVSATAAASAPPAASAAASAPVTEAPLPKVKVANIGIHIGGGPNDEATKEPFKKSVQPHYDEMRRCWGAMPDASKGDISIELKVEREGGKARVRPNQTTFKNKDFNTCVQGVFEKIDFLKPRTGTTVLNFSIRFTPENAR